MIKRRQLLRYSAGSALALGLAPMAVAVDRPGLSQPIMKAIPSSGEKLPVVGLGSSRTFDVSLDEVNELLPAFKQFYALGGSVIDSSPMYGNAEAVIGRLLAAAGKPPTLFMATKVWTDGRQAGIEQMQTSMQRLGVDKIDLMQIHNLRDWKTHLPTLREWREQGKIRYIGITTSHGRDHAELEQALRSEPFDFVQLSYNALDREVEKRLLPLAQDKGVAVLANRNFQKGALFAKTRGQALPVWAAEWDCQSWAQLFLKFCFSHPAVTAVIPATRKVSHMQDNMAAGLGRLPDAGQRQQLVKLLQA